jgi:hypothetical protein
MESFMKPTNWWWNETLPNFIKRKHPSKGKKRQQGAMTKTKQINNPKEGGHMEVKEPLSTKTSTSRLKHIH